MAAEVFGVAASALAVAEYSAKIALVCTQYIKDVSNAKKDIERLNEEVNNLGDIAKSVQQLLDRSSTPQLVTAEKLRSPLKDCESRLRELQQDLSPSKTKTSMSKFGFRALKWPFKSKDTEKAIQDVTRFKDKIILALQVDQTTIMLDMDQKMVLTKLPIADGAMFDSHVDEHNPCCLPDTRTEILRQITKWSRDPNTKTLYWLNGMAGTGKSTISRTLAHAFSKSNTLGATFFFKRGEGDRGGTSKLFATIASQLIQRVPETAEYMKATIDADPAIFSRALREQFNGLVIDPVSKIPSTSLVRGTRIIIIDALDECEREDDIRLLIKLLSSTKALQNLKLKFFLTSRPELPIRLGFDAIDDKYQDFILHEVEEPIIERDIAAYLNHELNRVREEFNKNVSRDRQLSSSWPDQADLQILVKMAIPLFIFAATVCRFVADRKGGNPNKKLQKVLEYRTKQGSRLNATYKPVLEQLTVGLLPHEQSDILQQFREIVGPVVLLANPLSLFALAQLLNITVENILDILDLLHSVLHVPPSPEQTIRLLHLSFRDFLIDPERRGDIFWIDEKEVHRNLAVQCLRTLNTSLKTNICGFRAPGTMASSVTSEYINAKIPSEVQYACRFWVYHLQQDMNAFDQDQVWEFFSSHFLHWLEVLSWMGRLLESIQAIKTLQSLIQLDQYPNLSEFLIDALRFILNARSSIELAPLQIYSSALAFTPTMSIIRNIYKKDLTDCMSITPRVPTSWGQNIQTLDGHNNLVSSVAFSTDGRLVVSGSHDRTVRIWATDTGELKQTLRGHSTAITSVALSAESKLIVSGSYDKTIRIWSVDTGKLKQTLKSHTDRITSVILSGDGSLIASGSQDNMVRIWAVDTGELKQTLKGHVNWVNSVAFSTDNTVVASGSRDKTIRIWAADIGELKQTLKGHTSSITSVALSADGKLVASGSGDTTVRIWAANTGELKQTLEGHTDRINSIALSADGKLIISGLDDGTVWIWTTDTGELKRTLKGHLDSVNSVALSTDHKLVISGSSDGTVRIWAADTSELNHSIEGHTKGIDSIALSADGKFVASGSSDRTVRIWEVETGRPKQRLEGHSGFVVSVVWSVDDKLVASGSFDNTVRIWSIDTGELKQTLEGHLDAIMSVALSADGKLVASGSADKTVRIWAVETGELQHILKGHTGRVNSVSVSADSKVVASGSSDKVILIWAVDTGELKQTLKGHQLSIDSVAISANGKLIASGSVDRTVRIWAVDTGELKLTLDVDTVSISFNASNTQIMTDRGVFPIQCISDSPSVKNFDVSTNIPSMDDYAHPYSLEKGIGYGVSVDQCWITLNGENVLWLPVDYRGGGDSLVSGSTVIIGCHSGKLLVIRFREGDQLRMGI